MEKMNWLLLVSGKCDPAFNMALDEALLEAMPRLQKPVLRFYGWTELAASFGYFQKYADATCATHLRPLIRRPTGGGIVPHDKDWTYSLVFPPRHEWYLLKAQESYRRVHEWVRSAFAALGIKTELAPCRRKLEIGNFDESRAGRKSEIPGQCFVGYEKSDLLWHGKKIAGAAQRRNKLGLLIQGSVRPPISLKGSEWEKAMFQVAQREFGIQWDELVMGEELNERAGTLTREKFSQNSFNRKR